MHNKMWKDLEEIRKAKCMLAMMFNQELCVKGENANDDGLGKVSDMIKDLAEAEEKCMKACYYKEIMDEMKEEREESGPYGYTRGRKYMPPHMRYGYPMDEYDEDGDGEKYDPNTMMPMGYDHWRYKSSGQFAPTGHGQRSGYTPPFMNEDMRYGQAYNEWKDARKHYTHSNSTVDKEEMDRKSMEHTSNVIMSMREIWKHAEPDAKKRIKADLTALVGELT